MTEKVHLSISIFVSSFPGSLPISKVLIISFVLFLLLNQALFISRIEVLPALILLISKKAHTIKKQTNKQTVLQEPRKDSIGRILEERFGWRGLVQHISYHTIDLQQILLVFCHVRVTHSCFHIQTQPHIFIHTCNNCDCPKKQHKT